jgi:hypothetical protein
MARPLVALRRGFARSQSRRISSDRVLRTRLPLRSDAFPDGKPDLEGLDAVKVEVANRIYARMAAFFLACCDRQVAFSVENPTRSLMWSTCWFLALLRRPEVFEVAFHQCMHGGERNKASSWFTNLEQLKSLALVCDGQHPHKPWGVLKDGQGWTFATAQECEYPALLCSRVTAAVVQHAEAKGVRMKPPTSPQVGEVAEVENARPLAALRAAAGRQPKGKRFPELIPEFCQVQVKNFDAKDWSRRMLQVGDKLKVEVARELGLPFCAKILTVEEGVGRVSISVSFGIFHTCEQFVEKARGLTHPFDGSSSIEDDALAAIFLLLTRGRDHVANLRAAAFRKYERIAGELEGREAAIHAGLTGVRAEVLKEKNFLLLQRMCSDAGVSDQGLVRDLVAGIRLTGEAPVTGEFPPRRREPAMSEEQVMKAAKWIRRVAFAKSGRSDDEDLNRRVWQASQDEIAKKWITGPHTEAELAVKLGPLFLVSRRFGIRQHDSVRVIDDMSESLVNACFGSSEKVDLGGIDELAVLARSWLEAVRDDRAVEVRLSSGKVLRGTLHASLTLKDARSLVGRTLDLEAAYKQLLVSESSRWAAVIRIWNADAKEDQLYVSEVLPFGASASVYGFNRYARALRKVGTRLFHLAWTNYFDDYPHLDIEVAAESSHETAEKMLRLVGWRFSEKPAKRLGFAAKFDALGVTVDLSAAVDGRIVVANKPSRVEGIGQAVGEMLSSGVCRPAAAASLRGRCQYAEGQLFGRATALCMPFFRKRAAGQDAAVILNDLIRCELLWVVQFLSVSEPRYLQAKDTRQPLVIFTDASLEANDTKASIGGVLFDGAECEFFAEELAPALLASMQLVSTHVIAALEVLPVACAMRLWSDRTLHRRVFYFIDNDAARAALIKMFSGVDVIANILRRISLLCAAFPSFPWYSRVPSPSNVADEPSRLAPLVMRRADAVQMPCDAAHFLY